MRKDVVVLCMVFVAGLLLGVFLTGGVMGTYMWTKAERYRMQVLEAEQEARMMAEEAMAAERQARLAAEQAREALEKEKAAKNQKP